MSQILESNFDDIQKAFDLLRGAAAGGNLTSDAQLAALSLRYRGVIHSADSDFARFPDIRWHHPLLSR